jgi:DNA-binding NtrC family response regulator
MDVPLNGSPPAKRQVLILDDEPIVCKRLRPAFQKAGYEVETFAEGQTALARVEEKKFDLIVTDLKMEGLDGLQFLARVKELNPKTEFIVITGFATLETAKESFRKGAYDFLAKPFKLSDLMAIVHRLEGERFEGGTG